MSINSLDFSSDEEEIIIPEYVLNNIQVDLLSDEPSDISSSDVSSLDDESITEDMYTDTEDDASVDLDSECSEDEMDLIEGEEEYKKFKHLLADLIEDDAIEDCEEYQPKHKRNKISQ